MAYAISFDSRLRLCHQLCDIGIKPSAVGGHHTNFENIDFPGEQQNLGEGNLKCCRIVAPEFGDCIMVRMAVGRDEAHRDIAVVPRKLQKNSSIPGPLFYSLYPN